MSRPSSSAQHHSSGSTPEPYPAVPLSAGRGDTPSNQGSASAPEGSQEIAELSSAHGQEPEYSSTSREEGYPSWLPKRPPPPAPQSTIQSNMPRASTYAGDSARASPEDSYSRDFYGVGRMPTPRSVRIISTGSKQTQTGKGGTRQSHRRETVDRTRAIRARVWSRGTTALSPTLISNGSFPLGTVPRPRFNSPSFHIWILRSASNWTHLRFYLYPLFIFAHIPIQTFFDFNAVFVLVEVSKFPTPSAPGVPGSGRGWALAAAAYSICWFFWFFLVIILYEIVYSFYRRWRFKRPLIAPLYFSSPAYNLVCMTSFNNFCFMEHIRRSARPSLAYKFGNPFRRSSSGSSAHSQHSASSPPQISLASWRDYIAETCYFYAQNLPSVVLLIPRAALCLALLLTFWTAQLPADELADSGIQNRDSTYFRIDGSLTDYSRGVLIANAAWTAWRVFVLLLSWFGLWFYSGMACGGICGPRYRWEEEEAEKALSVINAGPDDALDGLPWTWREFTIYRIQDAYELCLTITPIPVNSKKGTIHPRDIRSSAEGVSFDGMQQVLAAAGFPSVPLPARRGVLRSELFETPEPVLEKLNDEQPVAGPSMSHRIITPTKPLNAITSYPFVGHSAQASSEGLKIPFPPSPQRATFAENDENGEEIEEIPIEIQNEEDENEDEDDEDIDDEDIEDEDAEDEEEEEALEDREHLDASPAAVRASDSISSLGQPITSQYPFQFQHARRRGGRSSVGTAQSKSGSSNVTDSTPSRKSESTGNRESSGSPWSGGFESGPGSPSSPIPIPGRRPRPPRERIDSGQSIPPLAGRPMVISGRTRHRTESDSTTASRTFGPEPLYESDAEENEDDDDEDEEDEQDDENVLDGNRHSTSAQQIEAEQEDSVGLLSATVSPRASLGVLRNRGSSLSSFRSRHNSTGSLVRSRPHSRSASSHSRSRAESVRSRAQSLIHSIANASISSLPFDVRSRANSATRLSDPDEVNNSGSGSGSARQSGGEDNTFGFPMRLHVQAPSEHGHDQPRPSDVTAQPVLREGSPARLREAPSSVSDPTASLYSERTISAPSAGQSTPQAPVGPRTERSFISSANESFITAPPSVEGSSDTTGQTPSSWGGVEHYIMPQHGPGQGGSWRPA